MRQPSALVLALGWLSLVSFSLQVDDKIVATTELNWEDDSGPRQGTLYARYRETVDDSVDRFLSETGLARNQANVDILVRKLQGMVPASLLRLSPRHVDLQFFISGSAQPLTLAANISDYQDLIQTIHRALPAQTNTHDDGCSGEAHTCSAGATGAPSEQQTIPIITFMDPSSSSSSSSSSSLQAVPVHYLPDLHALPPVLPLFVRFRPNPPLSRGPAVGCGCKGQVFGEGCVSMLKTHRYLPEFALSEPCPQHLEDARTLQAELDRLQSAPESCAAQRQATDSGGVRVWTIPALGFGAITTFVLRAMDITAREGKAIQFTPLSLPAYTDIWLCGNRTADLSFSCFFDPIRRCDPQETPEEGAADLARLTRIGHGNKPKGLNCFPPDCLLQLGYAQRKPDNSGIAIVKGWKPWAVHPLVPDQSYMWYSSQLLARFWRLNTRTKEYVDRVEREIGLTYPAIAMHVRHGDACQDPVKQRVCQPLSEYMVAAREMRKQYGVNTIFLATDDEQVIRDSKAVGEEEGFRFVFISMPERAQYHKDAEIFIEHRLASGDLSRGQAGLDVVTDIELMSRCDMFIGTFSTNMGRIAYQRMMAKRNMAPPFISLDIAYCSNWGLQTDITFHDSDPPAKRPFAC